MSQSLNDLSWESLDIITIHALERHREILLDCLRDDFKKMARGNARDRLYYLGNFLDELENFELVNEVIAYYGGEVLEWKPLILKK